MPKRKKQPDQPPSQAYLMSFGDTMTTLLAFFIVLNSLAEEQTGANLYSGTGSFVRALESFGLQGQFSQQRSANAIPRETTSPLYMAPDPEKRTPDQDGSGPDADDDAVRVIDREEEDFERFMVEMKRLFPLQRLPDTTGEVAFDYFNSINPQPPHLGKSYADAMQRIIPLLYSDGYEVQVIVWATTPSPTAWTRAARQANQIVAEIAQLGGLAPAQRGQLNGVGRAWIDSVVKRPVLTFVVRKVTR